MNRPNMINYTDQTLIQMLKSIDTKEVDRATTYLFKTHRPLIIRILVSRSLNVERAKDIFNEGILALIKNIRNGLLDQPDTAIKPYLIAICKKKGATKFKQERSAKQNTLNIDDPIIQKNLLHQSHIDTLVNQERRHLLRELIEKLGKDCQTIILAFYYHKQKMTEIASTLNYANEQVARNKKSRCMKKLKEIVVNSPFYKSNLEVE